jgi:hypothetical protein
MLTLLGRLLARLNILRLVLERRSFSQRYPNCQAEESALPGFDGYVMPCGMKDGIYLIARGLIEKQA